MLTYSILNPKSVKASTVKTFNREEILETHLKKSTFQVGDYVRFKKPRRGRKEGTIFHIESEPSFMEWDEKRNEPLNISVQVTRNEMIKTSHKRIAFLRRAE